CACDRPHLCALRGWLCASRGRRLRVLAAAFWRAVGRLWRKKLESLARKRGWQTRGNVTVTLRSVSVKGLPQWPAMATGNYRAEIADSGDCERSFRLIVNAQEAWRRWGGSFTSSVHDPSTSDGSFGAIRP